MFDGLTLTELDAFFAYPGAARGATVAGGDIEGTPITLNGGAADDFFHVAGDGLVPPPGYGDQPLCTDGNDDITPGRGDAIVHAGEGVDWVHLDGSLTDSALLVGLLLPAVQRVREAAARLATGAQVEMHDVDGIAFANGDRVTLNFEQIEFDLGGMDRTVSIGSGQSGAGNEIDLTFDPTPGAPSTPQVTIEEASRVKVRFAWLAGDSELIIDGDLTDSGLETLVVDGRSSGGLGSGKVSVSDFNVMRMSSIVIGPDGGDVLLCDFNPLNAGGAALDFTTLLLCDVQAFTLVAPLTDAIIISGDLTPTGLSRKGLHLTTGDGDNLLDAAGVTSAHRITAVMGDGNDTAIGGRGDDVFDGGKGDDSLVGGDGVDRLEGKKGYDIFIGGKGDDRIDGGEDIDTASFDGAAKACFADLSITIRQNTRGAGKDTLVGIENLEGSDFNDGLTGDGGANQLTGGMGRDTLTGGGGGDIFVFQALADSLPGQGDRITDFTPSGLSADPDRIDLRAIDANSVMEGDQAFDFIGSAQFSGAAGELRAVFKNGDTVITADWNGDEEADLQITLTGLLTLAPPDFLS